MIENINNTNDIRMYLGELPATNYYNNDQNIVRVKMGGEDNPKFYDFYLMQNLEMPNPNEHYALIYTSADNIEGIQNAIMPQDPKLDLLPGYRDKDNLDKISWGFVWLVSKKIRNGTTAYNDSGAGMFNQESSLPMEQPNIKYSLSPPLNKDYTTTRGSTQGNTNNENIGVFVTDNSVLLKSAGGSILLGPQGISFLGDRFNGSSKGAQGMMQDNPFSGWFPSTIMTIPLGIEMIPNYNYILSIGTACQILNKGMKAIGKTTNNLKQVLA